MFALVVGLLSWITLSLFGIAVFYHGRTPAEDDTWRYSIEAFDN